MRVGPGVLVGVVFGSADDDTRFDVATFSNFLPEESLVRALHFPYNP